MTTLKATVKESTVGNNKHRFEIVGTCEINGAEKKFTVAQCYDSGLSHYVPTAMIENCNVAAMKELGVDIDSSELIEAYRVANAKFDADKVAKAKVERENKYDNSPLHWYRRVNSDWTISHSKEEFCDGSYAPTLQLKQGNAKICFNDKGQFELSFNYDVIKRSKVAERVQAAFVEHVRQNIVNAKSAVLAKDIRQELLQDTIEKLGLPITNETESHSRGHGRTYHSYTSQSFQTLIKDGKYDSDKKYVRFNCNKDELSIEKFQVGRLSFDQLKRIIAIVAE